MATMVNQAETGEPLVKYNNYLAGGGSGGESSGSSGKMRKSQLDEQQPCSSKTGGSGHMNDSQIDEIEMFQEVREITEKSQQFCSVIAQIRDTFHPLFEQQAHVVPLRHNKRVKQSVVIRHHKLTISMKIKFELYGETCINWLRSTIRLIKNFYDAWIPKAHQNVQDLKQTANQLEKSDEHISQLLFVKDSTMMGEQWNQEENVFLQHAIADLSTYILTHKSYRLKEKLHHEYTIIEQNIYALLDSLHSTLSVLKRRSCLVVEQDVILLCFNQSDGMRR
eukprot:sb/3467927/